MVVLDISYDAAHRRASNKSKLSLEETAILARHYGISLDNLFQQEKYVLVNKTKEINSFEDLSNYLSQSFDHLSTYNNDSTTEIYYSAKEDRKSTRLNSSHVKTSYAVFCLKKKTS